MTYREIAGIRLSGKSWINKLLFAMGLRFWAYTLCIEEIFATSPQAKGRVERANRTLQDSAKYQFTIKTRHSMK